LNLTKEENVNLVKGITVKVQRPCVVDEGILEIPRLRLPHMTQASCAVKGGVVPCQENLPFVQSLVPKLCLGTPRCEALPRGGVAGVEWPQAAALATGLERPFAPSFSLTHAVVTRRGRRVAGVEPSSPQLVVGTRGGATSWGRMAAQVESSAQSISAIRPQPPRRGYATLLPMDRKGFQDHSLRADESQCLSQNSQRS